MSTGALLFAHNNTGIDYIKLAIFAAIRIKRYLDIPVSIATDNVDWLNDNYPDHPFDKVINVLCDPSPLKYFYDGSMSSKELEWKNVTRSRVYDITPYDKTLVMDTDYIVSSDILKIALQRNEVFQIYKKSVDLASWRDDSYFQRINPYSIPFYWATVFVFEKSIITQAFFNLVSYIKENYRYFRMLYNIDSAMFRNDFAFSIAIHIMNGKTDGGFATELPGSMVYIHDRDLITDLKDSSMQFLVEKEQYFGEYTALKTEGLDVHVMNKWSLLRVVDGEMNV